MKKIEGGRHCGHITYEATVNPDLVVYATVPIARPALALLSV
jgi:hypothetical protein